MIPKNIRVLLLLDSIGFGEATLILASINASLETISRNIDVEKTAALQIDWGNGELRC